MIRVQAKNPGGPKHIAFGYLSLTLNREKEKNYRSDLDLILT